MKLTDKIPIGHAEHLRNTALSVSINVGIEGAIKILNEGLGRWPDELEASVKWVVKERRKRNEQRTSTGMD
ncbi:hypothetical protein [Sphingobacterium multivorum]|uniref:hypothetical protein n=1 Tax=Sphingobacterium multivorum TaxID=28454 RepID=UPI0028AD6F48|nr:hypothetical protein [Sphingobacterium multivorum]